MATAVDEVAGKWGDYMCDVPERTIDSVFEHVRGIAPDAVFWLGDSIPHDDDKLSAENDVEHMKRVSQKVIDNLGRLPIFATPGNHDVYPLNSFKDFKARDNTAFNEYAITWRAIIGDDDQFNTFLDWGYYAKPLYRHDGSKAATVISVNSNLGQDMDWNSLARFEDPGNMFAWLEQQLSNIEAEGGAAIIISHVPGSTNMR